MDGKWRYHLVLPDIFIPYRRYLGFTITNVILKGEPDNSCDADPNTQWKWILDFRGNGEAMNAYAAEILAGSPPADSYLPDSFLRSSWPQLERYRARHGAGWLSILAVSLLRNGFDFIK